MSEKGTTISDMPWFKFFGVKYSAFVSLANREIAGDVFKAVCAYVCDMPVEELSDPLAVALFQSIKKDIDDSFDIYLKRVNAGKRGGRPKNHIEPSVTNQNHMVREEEVEEEVEESTALPAALPTPAEPEKSRITRRQYGQYGWVKLSDEEYSRLLNDLGETEVKRCIDYVDESAQSNGNKNKWRDWNLVIRRCHRDGWGLRAAVSTKSTGRGRCRIELDENGEEVAVFED